MSPRDLPQSATQPRLGIRLFGHVKIDVDDEPFVLQTPRRSLALLTYLALHRRASVEREFISYLLWPDEEESQARTRLRGTLAELQRVLPPNPGGWLDVDGGTLRLRGDADIELDIERFETLARNPSTLREAVELYRGDLVEALYDEWIDEPRERFRALYLSSLDRLATDARRDRDFPLAVSCAQRILALDPWREDVVRRLIFARYESGDAAGALATYADFATRLRAEIGADPMPETLAARDAVARNAAVASEQQLHRIDGALRIDPGALPFIGRESENTLLDEAWKAAAAGRGGFAIVRGEAGIGKTRLLQDFAARVADGGGRVLTGATARPESTPYQPFVEALRSALPLVGALSLDPTTFAMLGSLLPELLAREGAPHALPPLDGERERERTLHAVARALVLLAKPRPLLLVLEDLHSAGEATLALLEFALRQVAGARVLVIATVREGEPPATRSLERARREASARGAATDIALRRLAPDDASRLVATRIAEPSLAAALCKRAEGHPLYLAQLIESASEGTFSPSNATLDALLAARTVGLSVEARTAGEIAAAIGRTFPTAMLGAVAGWSDADARIALDDLIARRLVREVPGRGLFDFEFVHQLLADAFLANAPPERMRDRHRRIAVNFEALFPDDLDELGSSIARHYDTAAEPSAAAPQYLAAGRRALRVGALDEAATLLRRCADIAPRDDLAVDALIELSRVCRSLGHSATFTTTVAELERLSARLDDPQRSFAISERKFLMASQDYDLRLKTEALAEMRTHANALGSKRLTAMTELWELVEAVSTGGGQDHLDASRDVAARFAELGEPEWECRALMVAAMYAGGMLRKIEVRELLEQSEAAAARSGSPQAYLSIAHHGLTVATRLGDTALAERSAKLWVEVASKSGDAYSAACGLEASAWPLSHRSRLGEAIAAVHQTLAFYSTHGLVEAAAHSQANLANLYIRVGAFEDAIAKLSAVADVAEPPSASTYRASLLTLAFVGTGNYDRALATGCAVLETATLLGNVRRQKELIEHIAAAEIGREDYASAIAYLTHALELCTGPDRLSDRVSPLALTAFAQFKLHHIEEARKTIDELLACGPYESGITEWPQRIDWIAAQVLRAGGDSARSRELLARANARTLADSASLEEPYRSSFLELPWHREIFAASEHNDWPTTAGT